jgi:outer membrane lipoprotein-sorting protein
MLKALALLALAGPAPQGDQQGVNPAAVVQKMIEYYNDARTMTGTIVMTTKVGEESGTITTTLQFEQPDKLYILQQKSIGDRRTWLVVSNGKHFAYDPPFTVDDPGRRLVELVDQPGRKFTIKDIYAAAAKSIGDRSTPLDIAIGRLEDLKFLRGQWKTLRYEGKSTSQGHEVNVIMGEWRPYEAAEPHGQYRMLITNGGELKEFAKSEAMRIPSNNQVVNIVTTWTVNLKKDAKPDPALWSQIR